MGILCSGELHRLRMHRDSAGRRDALHPIRATLDGMEVHAVPGDRDPSLHGVARGVSFPRDTAEHAFEDVEERFGGMVDGFDSFWLFAHYQHGLPELALRNSGVDRGFFLWLDLEEKRVNLCLGDCSCAGGRNLAFLVPNGVNDIMQSPAVSDRGCGKTPEKAERGGDFRQVGASKCMPDVCLQNSDTQSSRKYSGRRF